jgi:tRNA pseudouridine38-40 synthase
VPTYKLTIEYEGTRYSGWQTQGNTPKTIQGRLITAATDLLGDVEVGGAGRTDAGVHAAGQVAHLRSTRTMAPRELANALNDRLPHDIHVLRVDAAHNSFHARHDAQSRIYLYQIATRRTAFAKPFVWWIKDRLDAGAMSAAINAIEGKHDFESFSDRRNASESTLVVVDRVEIGQADDLILIRIGASHFLWKMVRKLIAALAEVGRGTMKPEAIAALLEKPARGGFEPSAPPSGLFLEAVTYRGEVFDRPLEPIVPVINRFPSAGRTKR